MSETCGSKHTVHMHAEDGIQRKAVIVNNYVRIWCLSRDASKDEIRLEADCLQKSGYIKTCTRGVSHLKWNSEL